MIGAILLALAGPAIGLKLGPPSPEQLAKDAPARQNAELIDNSIGPGWDAPFQIVATNPNGPITDAGSMAALEHFQHKVANLERGESRDRPAGGDQAGEAAAGTGQLGARLEGQPRPGQGTRASSARN